MQLFKFCQSPHALQIFSFNNIKVSKNVILRTKHFHLASTDLEVGRDVTGAPDAVDAVKVIWRSSQGHVVTIRVQTFTQSHVTQHHQTRALATRRPRIAGACTTTQTHGLERHLSLPYLILPYLAYLTLPCLPYLTLPYLTLLTLPYLAYLTLPYLPYFTLPYLSLLVSVAHCHSAR